MTLKRNPRRLILAALLFTVCRAHGQQKFALVIGNAAYAAGPLKNTLNDATDMKAALESLGFTVDLLRDGDLEAMEEAVVRLSTNLSRSPGSYGFFYYAGHGVQSGGENYLVTSIETQAFRNCDRLSAESREAIRRRFGDRVF